MLPVFVSNRIDLYVFQASSVIWFVPELFSSFTRNRALEAQTHDRASGFVLIFSMYLGIFLGIRTSFSAPQFAIPWDRTFLFGLGIFLMLAGVAFRRYAIWILGKYFTPVVSIQS